MKMFIVLIGLLFYGTSALANIAISPFFIEFDADSKNRSGQVRFTNTTDGVMTYTIKMVNFKQESDGAYTLITKSIAGNPFADVYLDYSPRLVTLKPLESQVIRIQRRGMAMAGDGEYVSHLLVQEVLKEKKQPKQNNKKDLEIKLETIYGVSIPIMIEKGNVSATARVKKTKVSSRDGVYTADVTVERFGTRSFEGSLLVKDDGKEIGRIASFRIFMTTPDRIIKVPLDQKPKGLVSVTLVNEFNNEVLESKSI